MNGFNVSGCVSNILRKVTVPTDSILAWRTSQDSRRVFFCSAVRYHSDSCSARDRSTAASSAGERHTWPGGGRWLGPEPMRVKVRPSFSSAATTSSNSDLEWGGALCDRLLNELLEVRLPILWKIHAVNYLLGFTLFALYVHRQLSRKRKKNQRDIKMSDTFEEMRKEKLFVITLVVKKRFSEEKTFPSSYFSA